LIDLGFSKKVEQTDEILCSPVTNHETIPPELLYHINATHEPFLPYPLSPDELTARDMWMSGVVLYYALTGSLPYPRGDVRCKRHRDNVSHKMQTSHLFTPRHEGKVSEEAKCFVRSLLQQDQRQRPTAAHALEVALKWKAHPSSSLSPDGKETSSE
jgi:serine/threonine protein kinase